MELALGAKLTEDGMCAILVTIKRTRDMHEEPCIFNWSARNDGCGPLGYLLFCHTVNGLRKINIDMDNNVYEPPQTPFIVGKYPFHETWEVAPEGNVIFMSVLSKRYRKELQLGAKYELVWPGGEIVIWDWGTMKQHTGQELGCKSPKICLPAARVTIEFNKFGKEEERQDSPPPISPSERMQVLVCIA